MSPDPLFKALGLVTYLSLFFAAVFGLIGSVRETRANGKLTRAGKWVVAGTAFLLCLSLTATSLERIRERLDAQAAEARKQREDLFQAEVQTRTRDISDAVRRAAISNDVLAAMLDSLAATQEEVEARTSRLLSNLRGLATQESAATASIAQSIERTRALALLRRKPEVAFTVSFPESVCARYCRRLRAYADSNGLSSEATGAVMQVRRQLIGMGESTAEDSDVRIFRSRDFGYGRWDSIYVGSASSLVPGAHDECDLRNVGLAIAAREDGDVFGFTAGGECLDSLLSGARLSLLAEGAAQGISGHLEWPTTWYDPFAAIGSCSYSFSEATKRVYIHVVASGVVAHDDGTIRSAESLFESPIVFVPIPGCRSRGGLYDAYVSTTFTSWAMRLEGVWVNLPHAGGRQVGWITGDRNPHLLSMHYASNGGCEFMYWVSEKKRP